MHWLRTLPITLLVSSLACQPTQEELANAPVQTADPVVVWIFLIGFVGAIIGGCIWYFFGGDKKQK